jgi:Fe(3+) dicitrate transport protein
MDICTTFTNVKIRKMNQKIILFTTSLFILQIAISQNTNNKDSFPHKRIYAPDITVVGTQSKSDMHFLPEIVGTNINAGKKNALIVLDNVQGNVVTNNMRQVMAKVPGIHIWESDGSGIQIGIAARGLSPNRSWEFNTRQNGYDIAADPFGYPEAYYNPQLQAVQRIEIVRGQGALQYGPQFGGLVNYILKNGTEINKKIAIEAQETVGSNGLFNSYTAIGGKTKKMNYFSFFDHRNANGWRENSRYYTNSAFATTTYHFNNKLSLSTEVMHSHIRSQQPGGLTDEQAAANPQKSLRSRNWFDIKWTTPAIILNYGINATTKWNTKLFATIGDRNSVGFLQSILTKDSINSVTGTFNSRVVNLDKYRNLGLESRIITTYQLGKMTHHISGGVRLYTGTTTRLADGVGTTGSDYNVNVVSPYPRDIKFTSNNAAVFVENIFAITDHFILIPGIRYEWLQGAASGRNGFTNTNQEILLQNIKRNRGFLLAGIGAEYHLAKNTEIYANISQAYRPIQFANLQAPPTTDLIDQDLKDAKGYNVDLGYRGNINDYLQFDISTFYLQYDNRIGTLTVAGTPSYRLTTNVGSSTSKGLESYVDINLVKAFQVKSDFLVNLFGAYSYTNASYSNTGKNEITRGKKVENAPENIFRGGIGIGYKNALLTYQLSSVSESFSDANNTETPTSNGNTGLIPAYTVSDITATYKFSKKFNVKLGVNNLFNTNYFTRRAGGYPGPGVLPADGRTVQLSVGMKF